MSLIGLVLMTLSYHIRYFSTLFIIFLCVSALILLLSSPFQAQKRRITAPGSLCPRLIILPYILMLFYFFDKIVTELLYRLQRFNHMNPLELDVHESHYDP